MHRRRGITLIEVVLSIGIIVMLFGGIYTAYVGIIDAIANSSSRAQASNIASQEIETIRNLAYDSVGTQGGIPNGILQQVKSVTSTDNLTFRITTTVRNIDDSFDGTLGGSPSDTAPADYKMIELQIECTSCARFVPLVFTTTVAPKNLESALTGGSLFLNVFGAGAQPIQGATVHVVNASVTPAIDLTDITNTNGILQLVGVPTSTQGYQITVSKSGYSSEKTYTIGASGNPNPVKPHATVAAQTLTQLSFQIDQTSNLTVQSTNNTCEAIPSQTFTLIGDKLLGTTPDVLKFTTSSVTSATGTKTFAGLEWATYDLALTGAGYDVAGYMPFTPFLLNPSSTMTARMVLATSTVRSVLVTVKDAATGNGVAGATINLSNGGGGYSQDRVTGRTTFTVSDWSGGNYISQDGGLDTESVPGMVTLVGPPYATSTESWLVSKTFDTGGAISTYYTLSWSPTIQPPGTTVRFQFASNNDGTTWNYVGPDGTSGTYYTVPAGTNISATHYNDRYLRYRAYLSTTDADFAPSVNGMSIDFNGVCVPLYQSLFSSLGSGTYTATVAAPGYQTATSSISVGSGWQEAIILMNL